MVRPPHSPFHDQLKATLRRERQLRGIADALDSGRHGRRHDSVNPEALRREFIALRNRLRSSGSRMSRTEACRRVAARTGRSKETVRKHCRSIPWTGDSAPNKTTS
jgi:hypothetical protein